MKTLKQFSETDRDYHEYQARQNFLSSSLNSFSWMPPLRSSITVAVGLPITADRLVPGNLDKTKRIGFREVGRQDTDGGKKTVSMFEMTKLVNKHLS